MKDLLIKNFQGKKVYSFTWKGRACWIAIHVAELLGYKELSKTVAYCINSEKFELGIEYDILGGDELKEFKKICMKNSYELKKVPKLSIFYEDGLYGFLQKSEMPLGVIFRTWIRREVLPELMEKGYYHIEKNNKKDDKFIAVDNINKSNSNMLIKKEDNTIDNSNIFPNQNNNIERFNVAIEATKLFINSLNKFSDDEKYKFFVMKTIFKEAGIEIP